MALKAWCVIVAVVLAVHGVNAVRAEAVGPERLHTDFNRNT